MAENSQTMLRHILESSYPSDHEDSTSHSPVDEENFNMLKDVYDACMDEERIEKAGAQPLIDILRRVQDLFPAMKPHEVTSPFPVLLNQEQRGLTYLGENELSDVVLFLMKIGVAPLLEFNIDVSLLYLSSSVNAELASSSIMRSKIYGEEMIKYNEDDRVLRISKVLDGIKRPGFLRSNCNSF